jgi:antitoxin component of MazEF toxin-antitoxin module
MHTRLSPRGHLKIPRRICQIIGLEPGDLVTLEIADTRSLLIRRAAHDDEARKLVVTDALETWAAEQQATAFRNP